MTDNIHGTFGLKYLLHFHIIQTGPGDHPASYPMGTKGSLPGGRGRG
jgi:hypothetical protein